MELYLDNSATTKVYPEVVDEMNNYFLSDWGNPSSIYLRGRIAKEAIENARERVAKILNCEPDEIYFTSGGSESDNIFIKGMFKENKSFITSSIEHPAVQNSCKELHKYGGIQITFPVTREGSISMNAVEQLESLLLKEKPIFATIMLVNNETGMIQPIKRVSKYLKSILPNIVIHTDAVQAVGKVSIDVKDLGVDSMSLSGHKFGAPKGIGILYLKKGIECNPLIHGGGQERGLRSGTENVPYIMGITKALEITIDNMEKDLDELGGFDNIFYQQIKANIPEAERNSGILNKVEGIWNICFKGINAQSLLTYLDLKDIYVSAGSACHSDDESPSHVLTAMGIPAIDAKSSLRFSFKKPLNNDEMRYLIDCLKEGIEMQKTKVF